jgi:hypothetical protein
MKIIFLDIDGVLNSQTNAMEEVHIDNRKMILLRKIIEATEANIVITSTWRINYDLSFFKGLFWATGFGWNEDGVTPRTPNGHRGTEIEKWLENYPDVKTYIIIDDDSDFHDHQKKFFVHTSWRSGLTTEHAQRAIRLLTNREYKT